MILTLQTQFNDDIDSTHSIVIIFTIQTQYSDDIHHYTDYVHSE